MSDYISRQAAIDAIVNMPSEVQNEDIPLTSQYDGAAFRQIEILGILEALPSAEPELDEWCTNCSEYDSEKHCCPRWSRVIRNTLKDAQPERKRGKWITLWDVADFNTSTSAKCSVCGRTSWRPVGNFCKWCGADLRGGENENSD